MHQEHAAPRAPLHAPALGFEDPLAFGLRRARPGFAIGHVASRPHAPGARSSGTKDPRLSNAALHRRDGHDVARSRRRGARSGFENRTLAQARE